MSSGDIFTLDRAWDLGDLVINQASVKDWIAVHGWAADEGWNPGHGDAKIFYAVDRKGFMAGRIDGQLVSAISVVNFSPGYAHLGHFFVAPSRRREGIGRATWAAGLAHAEGRVIGLDSVPELIGFFAEQHFEPAWRTLRYEGRPPGCGRIDPRVANMTHRHMQPMAELDIAAFPADRPAFALGFAVVDSRTVQVYTDPRGRVAGYGVLRRANDGMRIGPLYARTPQAANVLFDALCQRAAWLNAVSICIDIPEFNQAACEMAEARGLSRTFETTRMYRYGDCELRPTNKSLVYAVTSLELG